MRTRLLSKLNIGPTTLNGEYASIIRMRNLRRLCPGLSSALKMEVCDTLISRAACARLFPAFFLKHFARKANSRSASDFVFDMGKFLAGCIQFSYTFPLPCVVIF